MMSTSAAVAVAAMVLGAFLVPPLFSARIGTNLLHTADPVMAPTAQAGVAASTAMSSFSSAVPATGVKALSKGEARRRRSGTNIGGVIYHFVQDRDDLPSLLDDATVHVNYAEAVIPVGTKSIGKALEMWHSGLTMTIEDSGSTFPRGLDMQFWAKQGMFNAVLPTANGSWINE